MALSKSSPEEIPKDAVLISEEQALQYQWKVIKSWEKGSEVWALRHSVTVGAVMASLTGLYVNTHYRRKLRLGRIGHMSTYLPIVAIPAIFSVLTHKFFVQREIILDPLGQCPVCLQLRAAAFQTGCGVLYPTLLAPLAAFMFATRHFTFKIPSVMEKPKEVYQLWRKMSRPIMPTLGAIFATQAVITMFLAHKQVDQSVQLMATMRSIERKFDEEKAHAKHHEVTF